MNPPNEYDFQVALDALRQLDTAAQRLLRVTPCNVNTPEWDSLLAARIKAVGVLARNRKETI